MSEMSQWLEALGASRDVVSWAETIPGDHAALWRECPRGDWMLAIALRTRAAGDERARRAILAAGAAIAGLALDHVPDDDVDAQAVLAATARAAEDGSAVDRDAIDALERAADDASYPAVSLARRAIVLAARATDGDEGNLADLALVPTLVSQAAAHDAGDCAMLTAAMFVLRKSAELVREALPTLAPA